MNIYQSNTYRKDLSWLHFDDVPRVQEMKDQQSYISVNPAIPSSRSTSPNMTAVFQHGRITYRDKSNLRRKKLHRTNQGSDFLRGSFSNRDNVRSPIQFRRESQPQHLKRCFILKNRPIHFHINSTSVFRPVKRNQLSFSSIEITSHFLPQSTVSRRSDSSSEANSSCSTDQMPDYI